MPSVGLMAAPEIRTLSEPDELTDWLRAVKTGFVNAADISQEEVETRRPSFELARAQGAYDGGRCVATFRTFTHQLTVPGGGTLPSCAVSTVTVTSTHRRRGLLSRMMANALSAARERGEACATLISAEYPIYGRYGFGPAAWASEYLVNSARSGLDPRHAGPENGGRIDLLDAEEVRSVGPELHERFRRRPDSQGAIDRDAFWWQADTRQIRLAPDTPPRPFHAVYRDSRGVAQGMVAYSIDDHWEGKLPSNSCTVHWLITTTTDAERALWHFLLSIDWVSSVRSGPRPADDLLPLFLPDPRAARIESYADNLWLRPLDVPRMLEARDYPVNGSLVLELVDKAGFAGGRFRLEASPEGSQCRATHDAPDLSMEIGELGALYLGDEAATRLVTLGRVEEHRAGAATLADVLFRTARRPWCPDNF